jgi:hypothetical protein
VQAQKQFIFVLRTNFREVLVHERARERVPHDSQRSGAREHSPEEERDSRVAARRWMRAIFHNEDVRLEASQQFFEVQDWVAAYVPAKVFRTPID